MNKEINIVFGATLDFLPFVTVTTVSILEKLSKEYKVKVHFLYANIVKAIEEKEEKSLIEKAKYCFEKYGIDYKFYDVKDEMYLFDNQNTGMWGKNISLTHYIYLLAPKILTDVDKAIYIDTDMIVNCDLSVVYNIDMGDKLLGMGAPRGFEEMGDDVSNSGFVLLNLEQWRKEDTLSTLLKFGEELPRCNFCDQNLLYQYFTKLHSDRLMLLDKEYNIFPQLFPEIPLEEIKILHYTGWDNIKPWIDMAGNQRGGFLWWENARKTPFYESFIMKNILDNTHKHMQYKPFEYIFSIKNFEGEKFITVLGFKFKIKKGDECQ